MVDKNRNIYASLNQYHNTNNKCIFIKLNANRVQMNARLYFCRRANENMESMTKDTFVIRIYSVTGRRYVMKKVNEATLDVTRDVGDTLRYT